MTLRINFKMKYILSNLFLGLHIMCLNCTTNDVIIKNYLVVEQKGDAPYSFVFDNFGNLYLPNDSKSTITVYKNNKELTRSFKIPNGLRNIKYCNERNSLFIYYSTQNKIMEHGLFGEIINEFQISNEGIIDYIPKSDKLYIFYNEYIGSGKYDYYCRKINIVSNEEIKSKLNVDIINTPTMFQPVIYEYNKLFIIPSPDTLIFINDKCDIIKRQYLENLNADDGVIFYSNDQVITYPFDSDLVIKTYSFRSMQFSEIKLIGYLDGIFDGEFGKDYMSTFGGYKFDIKLYKGKIYLLGANEKKTIIFKITL